MTIQIQLLKIIFIEQYVMLLINKVKKNEILII